MNYLKSILVICMSLSITLLSAQEEANPLDTMGTAINKLQSELSILKKLKISGYIQAQYQIADTAGISSFAGGNFPATVEFNSLGTQDNFPSFNNSKENYIMQIIRKIYSTQD